MKKLDDFELSDDDAPMSDRFGPLEAGDTRAGIDLEKISFHYGSKPLFEDLSLSIRAGENVLISADVGSGKSTLLWIAAGLLLAKSGKVRLAGEEVIDATASERFTSGRRIGFVFQEGGLISHLNAVANVALPLEFHRECLAYQASEIYERAAEALEKCSISRAKFTMLPANLSPGDRRRVVLARAIAQRPRFVFVDDPTLGTDSSTTAVFSEILRDLALDPAVTLLIASNDATVTREIPLRRYKMQYGRLQEVRLT